MERVEYEAENPAEPNVVDIEQQLEDNAKKVNDKVRQEFWEHTEYIKADWEQKEVIVRAENERNINLYDAKGGNVTKH
ncbi:hypothetical protein IIM_05052 [Bacillus cereus VD107]|nr:hypothetical protein IIM_05052 [Bacillus cereus VD107]